MGVGGDRQQARERGRELRRVDCPRCGINVNPHTISPVDDERARILEALRIAKGLKSRAAELLGVSRTTLWRKMRELKLVG